MEQVNFNKVVTEHSLPLKRFAAKLTQDHDDAEDLLQDTMLKAMTNAEKFKEGTNLKGWLFTIMKNIFINNYRRAVNSKIFNDDTDNQFYINSGPNSARNDGEGSMVMKDINAAVAQLSDNLRTPFMMSYTGYKYHEISEKLQLPLGTVKVRIHHARKELMRKLHSYDNGN